MFSTYSQTLNCNQKCTFCEAYAFKVDLGNGKPVLKNILLITYELLCFDKFLVRAILQFVLNNVCHKRCGFTCRHEVLSKLAQPDLKILSNLVRSFFPKLCPTATWVFNGFSPQKVLFALSFVSLIVF